MTNIDKTYSLVAAMFIRVSTVLQRPCFWLPRFPYNFRRLPFTVNSPQLSLTFFLRQHKPCGGAFDKTSIALPLRLVSNFSYPIKPASITILPTDATRSLTDSSLHSCSFSRWVTATWQDSARWPSTGHHRRKSPTFMILILETMPMSPATP